LFLTAPASSVAASGGSDLPNIPCPKPDSSFVLKYRPASVQGFHGVFHLKWQHWTKTQAVARGDTFAPGGPGGRTQHWHGVKITFSRTSKIHGVTVFTRYAVSGPGGSLSAKWA